MDACDPKLDIENLRQMIRQNTGKELNLSRKKICQAYTDIQEDNLPLPPLVLSKNRTFMVDGKSSLKPKDYDILFASDSKLSELKRVAKKAGVVVTDNLTKHELIETTKRFLDGHKIREPIVLARKRRATVMNNFAMNTNVNVNTNRRVNNNLGVNVNTNVNRPVNVNTNRRVNNNLGMNTNRRVNMNTNRRVNNSSQVSFPKSLNIARPSAPTVTTAPTAPSAPSGPSVRQTTTVAFPTSIKPSAAARPSFLNVANKSFIPSKTRVPNKPGYVFTKGNRGLGMYLNTGAVEGPSLPSGYVPPKQNINTGVTKTQAANAIKALGIRKEKDYLNKLNQAGAKFGNIVTNARVAKGNEDVLVEFINTLNISNAKKSELKNKIATNSLNSVRREAELASNVPKANNVNNVPKTNNVNNVNKGNNVPRANNVNKANNVNNVPKANNVNNVPKTNNVNNVPKTNNVPNVPNVPNVTPNVPNVNNRAKFQNYLNTVTELNNSNKTKLLNDGSITSLNSLKNATRELINQRKTEKAAIMKLQVVEFLNKTNINQNQKNTLIQKYTTNQLTFNGVKNEASKIIQAKETNIKIKSKQSLVNFLNKETTLNQSNKNALIREFNNGVNVSSIQNKARTLDQEYKNARINKIKGEINAYMTNKSLTNDEKRSFKNSVTANTNVIALKAAINTRSVASRNQKKMLNRQNLLGHIESLGLTNQERNSIMSKFNGNSSNVNTLKNEATQIRNSKKMANREKLASVLNSTQLNQTQKNSILNKFNAGTSTLETLQSEIQELVKIKNEQNKISTRNGLKNYMNTLNITSNNKAAFLKELNNGESDVNTIKRKITNLINSRITEQQVKNRAELVNYLNTLELTEPNKAKIIQNFGNVLNLNKAKANAKSLANTRRTEKFEAEKANLRNFVAGLNINASQIIANFSTGAITLNKAKNLAKQLVNKNVTERRAANRKTLESHMNTLGLLNDEKKMLLTDFNDDGGNLNTLMKTATNIHQASIKRNLAMERQKVKNTLNAMNLTNVNKAGLLRQFNNGARNIEQKAIQLIENRKTEKLNTMRAQMKEYVNYLGLTNEDKKYIMNKITSVNANINALRNEAKNVKNKRNINARAAERNTISEYMNSIGLNKEDKNTILNKFNSTNASLNTLRKNANDIAKTRKDEKYITNKKSLENHMNTLGLDNSNRLNLLSKLNSPSVTIKNIISEATNLSIQRKEEQRAKDRSELKTYVNTLELSNDDKEYVMKLFDDESGNVESIKKQGRNLVNTRKSEKTEALTTKFKTYINGMPLNQSNKNVLMRNFNANVNKNVNAWSKKANTLLNQRKGEWKARDRNELNRFMTNLNLPGNTKLTILKNFDNGVGTLNTLKNRSQSESNRIKNEKKAEKRAELSNYLEKLNINPTNRNGFLQKYDNAPNTVNVIKQNAKNMANSIKTAKRAKNLENFDAYMSRIGLGPENKNSLMQSLSQSNVSLENMKARANGVLKDRISEKRTEFSKFLSGLNLSNENRNSILKQFDNDSSDMNNLEKRATNLVNQRKSEKRTSNRNALSNYVKNLELNQTNKNSILKEFNNSIAELNVMKTKANELVNQRRRELINSKRQELNNYTNKLNLTGEDKNSIMSKFNNTNGNISVLKNEADKLSNRRKLEKVAMNRKELTNMLNTLNITNVQKTDLLKKFNSGSNTLNTLKQAAANMNTNAKNKAATRAELRTFLNGLNLNNSMKNGLVKKLNDGSATLNAVKNEATALNASRRAELVNKKKDELRNFMSNKNLTNTERNAFIARVTNKNTNLTAIKQNITNTNTSTKKRKQESANRALKLDAFLNTLNLTNDNKKTFKNQLLANNTNSTLNTIKNRATNINAERQKAEANRKRQEDRDVLEQHLKTMTHLTGVDIEKYMSQFNNSGTSLQNVKNASIKNNEDKAKVKNDLKKQIEGMAIANDRKKQYINQINKPYVNITPIQALVEKNVANAKAARNQLKKNVATQLQALETLEKTNRTKFMERLNKGEDANKIIKNASKINSNRRTFGIKRNMAAKLQAMPNLERENRKKLMNNLNKGKSANNVLRNAETLLLEKAKKPLFEKIIREIPGKTGVFRRDWETMVKQAKTKEDLTAINTQLDEKIKLRENIRASNISNKEKTGHEAWIMKRGNDISKRRDELAGQLNAKKKARNALKQNTATRLQALNTLEKANRTQFMDRLNKGNTQNAILANASKLDENRRAAEKEKIEKERRDKLRKNTAALLQNKKKLTRDNRKEFMNRLEKGEDPNMVLKNANTRNSNATIREGVEWKLKQIKGLTNADVNTFMKRWNASKNKTIFNEARQLVKTRENGFSFNNANRPNKKTMTAAERFNNNAKNEIRRMRFGVKNQNAFIRRINAGESITKVLADARTKNKSVAKKTVSKTKQNLQYANKVKNVVRRL